MEKRFHWKIEGLHPTVVSRPAFNQSKVLAGLRQFLEAWQAPIFFTRAFEPVYTTVYQKPTYVCYGVPTLVRSSVNDAIYPETTVKIKYHFLIGVHHSGVMVSLSR